MNRLEPTGGTSKTGSGVIIGYYDQEQADLNPNKTIFAEISDAYPTLTNTKIRNVLAAFVFTGDDVFKTIDTLSGGEKGRVALAKIMLSNANFLILDEPTNHLDTNSKEILENVLKNYTGTVLYISHDRYFINNTAEKVVELSSTGAVTYLGNYDYYLEKKETVVAENKEEKAVTETKLDWKKQKEANAIRRKCENAVKKTEADIEKTETEISELEEILGSEGISSDVVKLREAFEKKEKLEEKLAELYDRWEKESEELNKLD
jgi:ATP-binding cassette subfamily F protein 3